MKCPNCKDKELLPKEIEPGLIIAECFTCDGQLFPLMNYRHWLKIQTSATKTSKPDVNSSEAKPAEVTRIEAVEDSKNVKVCPNCSHFLAKFNIGSGSSNKLELCNHCDHAWLDAGEWAMLKSLGLEKNLAKIFTDAWQYQVRKEHQREHLDERYKKILGESDFNKVKAFKDWLDQQPEKSAIKQYLITEI